MKKITLILLLIISVFYCSNAFAKNITVTGVGITEAEATNDALRNAVETAVGVLVDSTTIVDKNMVLEDKIYAHSRGFINQYSIINKQKMADAWKIMINAEVDLNPNSKLMNELTKYGLIDHILRNPKIAVIINEKNRRYYNQGSAAEIALTNAFIEAGFENMVDISQERIKYYNPFNLNADELHTLASSMQADILIVGNAFSEYVGDVGKFLPKRKVTGTLSCRAQVEAKMYFARNGKIIASDTKNASAVDISESVASKKALTAAGNKMGELLSSKLLEFASGNRQPMQLVVISTGYDKLNVVENALIAVSGVKNVNLNDYTEGKGIFTMHYSGSPKTLFEQLQKHLEYNYNIELKSSSYNELTIVVW
ncbi:MAG TPA: hypothetical protein H9953_06075 [Candidatus Fusicatenibacter intestinipullorum]|nr:hypothetical protein [Candidatus Fusicatenibacter intestinipullorum]